MSAYDARGSRTSARGDGVAHRRGTNIDHVAEFNESVLLSHIRTSPGGTSRAELRSVTGLAPQTVSDVCQRLLDRGLIVETGTSTTGKGRPRRVLELVPDSRYALGVHLDPATVSYVLLDLAGRLVAHATSATRDPASPDGVLQDVHEELDRLLADSGVDRSRVLGVGLAAPGPLDIDTGVLIDPPHLPGWHGVPLRDRLAEITGFRVVLDKDVTAAAIAEHWAGAAADSPDFVFLYLGSGVGAGVVTSDVVVRGRSGNAGDIGHLRVDADGPACELGHRGCFGTVCSPLHLIEQAVAAGIIEPTPQDADLVHAVRRLSELRAAADGGVPAASAILDRAASNLARAISTIVDMHDTELVVCGGPAWSVVGDYYLPRLQRIGLTVAARGAHPLSVVGTALGGDVAATGAACLILDEQFAARPSALLLS